MKRKVLLYLTFILTLTSCKEKPLLVHQINNEITINEIKKNVFLVTHSFPWAGNSLLIKLDKENILWIDTPYTPEATAKVLDWIDKYIGENYSITEINTGFHIDNLGGNQELLKRNIPIYGSDLTCKLLTTRSKITMSNFVKLLQGDKNKKYRDKYKNFHFYDPTNVFEITEEQNINIGKTNVIIYYPGPTHTLDNLVVYIADKKILFGGCMILSEKAIKTGYIGDGNLNKWEESLINLEKRFKDIEVIVPGHGEPGDIKLIHHTKDLVISARI